MFGLMRLWNQIRVERKPKNEERSEDDYLIRGESNQVLRWGLTLVVVLLHVVRVFYFAQGYFLLTFIFGLFYLERLHQYMFAQILCVRAASDWSYTMHLSPDGQLLQLEPRISAFFIHKLSPDDFNSFVNRVLEFKFWFTTTRTVLLAFLLTWIPFLKCSLFGPKLLFLWIASDGCQYVRAVAHSVKKPAFVS